MNVLICLRRWKHCLWSIRHGSAFSFVDSYKWTWILYSKFIFEAGVQYFHLELDEIYLFVINYAMHGT